MVRRVVVMGAAGRDFHNFNTVLRDDPAVEVVAFTAAQIPGIAGRRYPASLAGRRYPSGIPILPESELEQICRTHRVDQVIFAYSDVPHADVMHAASRALAAGADFALLGPRATMLQARLPVIAVSAVRTGCGKSQVARWLSARLRQAGRRVAVMRHPMPYGDLEQQAVQRFASHRDLAAADCTVEEREEYEPHIAAGGVVFAGVDYARVLALAEAEAEVLLWDGGNNDFPFITPDLHIALVDALRPGHETAYHPGEAVLRMADVVVLAKADMAERPVLAGLAATVRAANPGGKIVKGGSPVVLERTGEIKGKRVLVIEDGPTITHGGMPHGAGFVAASRAGAIIVDPRPWLAPPLRAAFETYPHIGPVLPALGYDVAQLAALARTIAAAEADFVVAATPVNLAALIEMAKPVLRARYEFADLDSPGLGAIVDRFLSRP